MYCWAIGVFIRSIIPTITADNYSVKMKIYTLLLEIYFCFKATYFFLFNKKMTQESFLGHTMFFYYYLEFFVLFCEMFGLQEYKYKSKNDAPHIIDCGSSWGMSVLYFKHFFPRASIIAIEANPTMAKLLAKNKSINKFKDVKVYNALLSKKQGKQPFFVNKSDSDWHISDTGVREYGEKNVNSKQIHVPTIQLSKLITKKVDLLKLDIEGMEREVMEEAKSKIRFVKTLYMEYHGGSHVPRNSLKKIIDLLKENDFNYRIFNTKNWLSKKENYIRIIHANH